MKHLFLLIILLHVLGCSATTGRTEINRISPLIKNGGYILDTEKTVRLLRVHDQFIPASTLKIITCLAALDALGKNFYFETHLFLDQQKNLYIKGFGDPFLTSESIWQIAEKLRKRGIRQLANIYLDDTSFTAHTPPGSENSGNPYDAPNGALVVNFNSMPIHISRRGIVSSGEQQTPTIPLMRKTAAGLKPGSYRFNVASLPNKKALSLPLQYAGQLFIAQLAKADIKTLGHILKKSVPASMSPIIVHRSTKSVEEITHLCLMYSNNYIANQLYLRCGANSFGFPATWDKAHTFLTRYIHSTLALKKNQIHIVEGSGLSPENKITPLALFQTLMHFKPYAYLLDKRGDIYIKSGTLHGVFCFAGYFHDRNQLRPFVILLNQTKNTRNDILKLFRRRFF